MLLPHEITPARLRDARRAIDIIKRQVGRECSKRGLAVAEVWFISPSLLTIYAHPEFGQTERETFSVEVKSKTFNSLDLTVLTGMIISRARSLTDISLLLQHRFGY